MTIPDLPPKAIPLKKCKPITYCKFCKAEGEATGEAKRVRCTVMTRYTPPYKLRNWYKHYSCDDHKHLIEDPDPHGVYDRLASVNREGKTPDGRQDHYTEADYQTWLRLL